MYVGKELSPREQNTRKGLTGLLLLTICAVAVHADGSEAYPNAVDLERIVHIVR